ncbi:MAG: hypothetical protein H6R02_3020 [Burkholderiaceae bacterium]|jgi:long-subunit fatty acid transport protein|nr:hypothetical protein [Burkholderiaceae bacterium]
MMLRLLVAISLVVLAGKAPAAGFQLSPADEAAAFKQILDAIKGLLLL